MSQLAESLAGQFDRLPPHAIEAEMCLLASMMLDKEMIGQVVQIVDRDSFYQADHQIIYDLLVKLYEQNRAVDAIILREELIKRGLYEEVGGREYLAAILGTVPSAAHGVHYATIVREKALLRQLISASNDILRDAYAPHEQAELVLDKAEKRIFDIAQKKVGKAMVPMDEVLYEVFEMIENRGQRGLETGFFELDDMLNGLQSGEMIIIAARPSMGKCLSADSEIVLDDGRVATIEQVVKAGKGRLLTLNPDGRLAWTEPAAFVDDGLKPVYRVTTRLGRSVECTLTHPFLTAHGWRHLSDLKVGGHVAVPARIDAFGTATLTDSAVEALGFEIGRGSAAQAHSGEVIRERASGEAGPAVLEVVRVEEKTIPEVVFRLPKPQLALFLNRLFAGMGWGGEPAAGRTSVRLATASRRTARQVQHLLLRFGIVAALTPLAASGTEGGRGGRWEVSVTRRESLKAFAREIGLLGATGASGCPEEASEVGARDAAAGDIIWDRIESIWYVGRKQVYDLTIADTHNFVANDICVHNTAFAMNIIEHVAADSRLPCAVFSLEMSKQQLAQRMLCSRGQIDAHKLRKGLLQSHEYAHLANVVGELAKAPIWVDDSPGLTPLDLRAKARRLKLQHDIKCIMIDYMQLMDNPGPDSRQQQISEISRGIKAVARELNVPVLALSQLNRASEGRDGHRPRMSDLRESGSIEQDADVIMLLHREDYYRMSEPDFQPDNIAEVIIAKQRNGPTGTVKLTFLNKATRFENLSTQADPF